MSFNKYFKESDGDSSLSDFFLNLHKKIDRHEKVLIIIRGASGSGKSTFAKKILALHPDGKQFETDDLFIKDGEYKFDFTKLREYHAENFKRVSEAMKEGVSPIVLSNTSIKKWEMQTYIDAAKATGYYIIIKKMSGEFKNEHGVPEDKVKMMRNNFEELSNDDLKNLNAHLEN
jgi:adenylate kinase family enzyme